MKQAIWFVCAAVLLSGCYTFQASTYYPEGKYAPTDPSRVQLYRNDPPRAFEVVGEAHLSRGYMMRSDELELKKQAAAMGGDAVVWTVKKECGPVMLTPAKTDVVVTQTSGRAGDMDRSRETKTIETTPAQVTQNCADSIEGRVIRFTR